MNSSVPDFAEQRRSRIAALVRRQGSVRLADLVEPMGVSEPTLRKDLTALEKSGHLRRTHGGAIAVEARADPGHLVRRRTHLAAKATIADQCAQMVEEGQSVYLDSGSTIEALAEVLGTRHVNVLTNAPAVAATLADRPGITPTLLGGQYDSRLGSLVGPLTVETLSRFQVDLAFIGSSGITPAGLYTVDVADGYVKQAAVHAARRVVAPWTSPRWDTRTTSI